MARGNGNRILMCCAVLAMVLALMAACVAPAACAAAKGAPYKIGALFAITGPASPLGTPERDTALLMEKQINAAGGIKGRPVDIIIYDTKSNETETVLAAKNLINQGVVAIVGPSQTGESLALLDLATRTGIPIISCAAGVKIVRPVN